MIQSKPVKPFIVVLFILLNFILIYLSARYVFSSEYIWSFSKKTSGLIEPNLITFGFMSLLLVGGLLMGWGRIKIKHLGLKNLKQGVLTFVGLWVVLQIIIIISELFGGKSLAIHSFWTEPGTSYVLGFFIAMIFGTALYEELAFRGFLLPQFYFLFSKTRMNNFWITTWTILLVSLVFSLWHIPSLILIRAQALPEMGSTLLSLWGAGIILSILYLRTANLYIPIAIHALVNAPTPLMESSLHPSMIIMVSGLVLIFLWPYMVGRPNKPWLYSIKQDASSKL